MAIAFDSSANGDNGAGATTLTISHTCSGSNRILFAHVRIAGTADSVTGATYNSVAMTKVESRIGVNNMGSYLFMLVNPDTGTHDFVATAGSSIAMNGETASYTGAKQTDQPDDNANNAANSSSLTTSITTVADNCWAVLGASSAAGNIAASTNLYLRQIGVNTGSAILDSNTALTPAGAYNLIFTADSGQLNSVTASFAPYSVQALTMDTVVGDFALTGVNVDLKTGRTISAQVQTYTVVGISPELTKTSKYRNQAKNTSTFTNQAKNSSTFVPTISLGRGWKYNRSTIHYNDTVESSTGFPLYYNSVGTAITYTNQTKS